LFVGPRSCGQFKVLVLGRLNSRLAGKRRDSKARGRMCLLYLRAFSLSDAWIAAERANLSTTGGFYAVSTP
jgi:hypothetical protein